MSEIMDEGAGAEETQVDVPVTDSQESDPILATDHAARTRAAKEAKVKAKEPVKEPDLKPWETKEAKEQAVEKGHTPRWARERLKEVTGNNRELKSHVDQLSNTVQQLLSQFKPKATDVKEEDFPSKADYIKYLASQEVTSVVSKVEEARQKQDAARKEHEELSRADEANTAAALKDIPDYWEGVEQGDPDLTLPVSVIKHLQLSPAGAYTRYRIATDVALSQELKGLSPQAKIARVSQVHDGILGWLIKKGAGAQSAPPAAPQPARGSTPEPAPRKPAPQAAPPRARGGSSEPKVNPLTMTGDEYVKWYNAQQKRS